MRFAVFASILFLLFSVSVGQGCRKDVLNNDPNATLYFSSDTIVFDTVFTTIGSATRHFLVHNFSSKTVKISSIRVAGGSTSPFHINVDGVPVVSTGDILLRGGDSMYVFVDVTINPNNSNNPLMVEDSILFETNGNRQHVVLNAVGQDAYFHYYETLSCGEVWMNDKPHVIYGYAIIPPGCDLTVMPGTRVHLHKNAFLAADSAATLRVLGNSTSPVTFQGDRLEPDYAEEPGQWLFIWLSGGSVNNVIDWAVIKNASAGIRCDTTGASPNPVLTISNTKIRNMSFAGILGVECTSIDGYNLSISNCAQACVYAAYGGKYRFRHCSFGNYWSIDTRTTPAVVLNNWYKTADEVIIHRDLTQADFYNCILYGPLDTELGLDSAVTPGGQFHYFFSHCVIRTNIDTSDPLHFQQNYINADPAFTDAANSDLHINGNSSAIDRGDPNVSSSIPYDLDDHLRFVNGIPDIGAYEKQ